MNGSPSPERWAIDISVLLNTVFGNDRERRVTGSDGEAASAESAIRDASAGASRNRKAADVATEGCRDTF